MKLQSWLSCKKCALWKTRRNVVIGAGEMPAKILFIGEAPGKSEDLRGEPFIGPAGRILRMAITDATTILKRKKPPTHYITNVVACRPCDEKRGPNRQPNEREAWRCWPRLHDIEKLVKPRKIVFLGKVAETYCSDAFPEGEMLQHPAYILRRGGPESIEYRRFVRRLSEIFKWAL